MIAERIFMSFEEQFCNLKCRSNNTRDKTKEYMNQWSILTGLRVYEELGEVLGQGDEGV